MTGKQPEKVRLVDLRKAVKGPLANAAFGLFGGQVEKFLGVKEINAVYRHLLGRGGANPFSTVLKILRIKIVVAEEDLARIPKEGPLMVLANHPYGGADAVALGSVLADARSDFKLLANSLVWDIEPLRPWLLPVNPFGGREAAKQNVRTMRDALAHLKGGKCFAMFPAGEVSSLNLDKREIADPKWTHHAGKFVREAKATVVPVYFEGSNGAFFHAAGLVNPLARTALLIREFMKKRGTPIRMRIGEPIPFRKLEEFGDDEALTEFLRLKTYLLGKKTGEAAAPPAVEHVAKAREAIIPQISSDLIAAELASLPPESNLVELGNFSTHIFHGEALPHTLREIGRLREITFREVGEGTGKSCDVDDFDSWYEHLVLWDKKERRVAGAYRIGRTDRILEEHGKEGLYTATLFHFRSGFFARLDAALEMGRSFIISEYWRKPQCMPLLWRAIARYAYLKNYRVLYGPVSISAEYSAVSRDLILAYLKKNKIDVNLAGLVRAKNPPRRNSLKAGELESLIRSVDDIEQVSHLVSGIEKDKKPVPVLLKHYLKLNGRMLSFNIDPDFGDCLDGLVLVDLVKVEPRFMFNMMGEDEYREYCARLGVAVPTTK